MIHRYALLRRRVLICGTACSLCALGALLFVDPRGGLLPACPIHQLLGLQCPGCGGTRALAALVRGDFRGALRQNVLVVASLPLLAWYAVRALHAGWRSVRFAWPCVHSALVYAGLAASVAFTVIRNL